MPVVADVLDVATAPISALVVHALFGSTALAAATFAEEILPGTDGIPSATLAWIAQQYNYAERANGKAKEESGTVERPASETVIDVEVDA